MPYIPFTDQQKEQANNINLEELLRGEGETLKRSGSEWEWLDREGAKVTIRGNQWFHQYDVQGGGAVSFVRRFYNLSYPEAMLKLLGYSGAVLEELPPKRPQERKPFVLPPQNSDMRRVFAYLMQKRFIDREIISHFAHEKMLYEDAGHHNAVFVGYDKDGVARHAHKKSTYSVDDRYRGNVAGCRPEYSFHHTGTSPRLYVFEAPIDMLAYITLHKENWRQDSYVALCCVAEHAMVHQFKEHPKLDEVIICTDHDAAGIEAFYRLRELLHEKGYLNVRQALSKHKDWDEDLKALHGQEPQLAEEHPKLMHIQELCGQIGQYCQSQKSPTNPKRMLYDGYNRLEKLIHSTDGYGNYAEEIQELSFKYAAYACFIAREMHRQLGETVAPEQLAEQMKDLYLPHKDKALLPGKLKETGELLQSLRNNGTGVSTESEYRQKIDNVLRLGLDFLRINSFVALEQRAATQGENYSLQIS